MGPARRRRRSAAWARVPLASAPGLSAAALAAQTLVTDLGRFADAEALLIDNLAQAGAGAAQLRYLLTQLFYWEGRLDEMRLLLQQGWSDVAATGPATSGTCG